MSWGAKCGNMLCKFTMNVPITMEAAAAAVAAAKVWWENHARVGVGVGVVVVVVMDVNIIITDIKERCPLMTPRSLISSSGEMAQLIAQISLKMKKKPTDENAKIA